MSIYAGSGYGQFDGVGTGDGWPNPFVDIASLHMPSGWKTMLYWVEHIFSRFGTYRTAMERVISYFLTGIEFSNLRDDERTKWENFMDHTLGFLRVLQSMWRHRQCYGNAFASFVYPIKRMLRCPRCASSYTLAEMTRSGARSTFNFRYDAAQGDKGFHATCPRCKVGRGYTGQWHVDDRSDDEENKLSIRIWSPHQIESVHCLWNDQMAYFWRIPEDLKKQVRAGGDQALFQLERLPKGVLNAIAKNQVYMFHEDAIFHMKEPTLQGLPNRGWGIPRLFSDFRQVYYVQVLRRSIEAFAMDYVVPFRVITPAPQRAGGGGGGGGMLPGQIGEPLMMFDGADVRGQLENMVRGRRQDPCRIQVLPFPVQFQMFGAEANQLIPAEALNQGYETLLNDANMPVEMYRGSLTLQNTVPGLRLFESSWHPLVYDGNEFLRWTIRTAAQILGWEVVEAQMKRTTIADNMEQQMLVAQLMMSQQVSGSTMLSLMGMNWKKEQRQIADEATYGQELMARSQEEMQQSGFAQQMIKGQGGVGAAPAPGGGGGGMPPAAGGGAPPAGAGGQPMSAGPITQYLMSAPPNVPQTPDDMSALAQALADELIGIPDSIKDSELRKLRLHNDALHGLVVQKLKQRRGAVRRDAGNQALASMQGQM